MADSETESIDTKGQSSGAGSCDPEGRFTIIYFDPDDLLSGVGGVTPSLGPLPVLTMFIA